MTPQGKGVSERRVHRWAGTSLGLALVIGLVIGAIFGDAALGASVGVVVGAILEITGFRPRSPG